VVYTSKKDCVMDMYYDEGEMDVCSRMIVEKVMSDRSVLDRIMSDCNTEHDKLVQVAADLDGLNYRGLPEEVLYKVYDIFLKQYVEVFKFSHIVRAAGKFGQERLEMYLAEKTNDKKKAIEYLNILTATPKDSYVATEGKELLELGVKVEKGGDLQALIDEHTKKFCWTSIGYYDEQPNTREHFLEEYNCIKGMPGSFSDKLQKLKDMNNKIRSSREAVLSELSPEPDVRNLADMLSEMTYIKDYAREALSISIYSSRKIFAEIGRRIGEKESFVKMMTPEEINFALHGGQYDRLEIGDRIDHYVLVYDWEKEDPMVYTGEKGRVMDLSFKFEKTEVNEVQGSVASLGHAIGKAKIILSQADFSKFEQGDILISPMTTPDFVPLMKKAAAIVTDEGGITCHAAIVSRELGVPCIIGTQIASKVFKDGELVEVKANHGVVRRVMKE
jgi:phosphohistidine swiveling domain-containing protein